MAVNSTTTGPALGTGLPRQSMPPQSSKGGSTGGKGSSTGQNTGMPAWANTSSDAYKNMNSFLQTAPMAAAGQTFAQGGMGHTSQNAMNQLTGMGGSDNWMNQAANSFQNVGQISEDPYRQMVTQAGQPGAAEQYLTGYARGDYLNGS